MCDCKKESCCGKECGCSSSCCDSSCKTGCGSGCGCGCNSGEADKGKKLLYLADQAWMELLKDKIKKHIEANDKKLDELAKIVSEANHERWKRKMEKEQCCSTYREKLEALFGSCSTNCRK